MWSHVLARNTETDKEHDGDCVEQGFQLARVKSYRNGDGGRKAFGVGNCSINI